MIHKRMLAVLLMLGMGCWLTALAADDKKTDKESGADKEFATKASAAGLAEVNLSELAVRFAQRPDVRQFAQRMLVDHKRANAELTQLANQRGIGLAKGMDEKHTKLHEKLAKLSGNDFDHEYMEGMVKDHEEAVKLFEKQSKEGKDAAMKEWAGKLTPILKDHLKMARDVCKETKSEKKNKDESDK